MIQSIINIWIILFIKNNNLCPYLLMRFKKLMETKFNNFSLENHKKYLYLLLILNKFSMFKYKIKNYLRVLKQSFQDLTAKRKLYLKTMTGQIAISIVILRKRCQDLVKSQFKMNFLTLQLL